jgi:thymidylate kinase
LLIGDDATKNYHLPIETAYLRSANHEGLFPIPAPEFEFIVLVVRLMLKHGSPEAILTGRGRLSSGERCEMDHLSTLAEPSRLRRALQDDVQFLDERILALSIRALEPGCPIPIRLEAWRALRLGLAPHARRARPADVWLQTSRRIGRRFRGRVLGRPARRHLSDGGRVVAIVGGDGAGKSTTVAELARWLSPLAPTVTLHLGKPRRSAPWFVLRGTIRLGRAIGAHPTWRAAGTPPPGEPNGWSYLWLLTGVVNARDRSREAARAHVLASRGAIVLCDRYPLPGTIAIDGPRLDLQQASKMTGLRRRSAELERAPYGQIRPPDLVVVLRVDPDVAIARRPQSDPRLVRSRAEHVRTAPWPAGTLVVEADAPRECVLRDVKAGIWTRL